MERDLPVSREDELPLACDLTAITPTERTAHYARVDRLISEAIQERQELTDGYAFRYHADAYKDLVAFIGNERLCCPFFRFTLEVSPAQGPIWLRITGDKRVKEFFDALLTGEQTIRRI